MGSPAAAAPGAPGALSAEVRKFDDLAHEFWDPRGAFHPLHALNPVRIEFIAQRVVLPGSRVLDIGCGGGLLSEALARRGADVTGIDLSPGMIEVARLHAQDQGLALEYRLASAPELARTAAGTFDVIVCMELIEHVEDPAALLAAAAALLRPGGQLFLSTLDRTLRSFLLAIVGAEYLLGAIPRGTHRFERFLRPSELARWGRACGLELCELAGVQFNPFTRSARLGADTRVNYLAQLRRAR
jgi:2-polyprenyl-6-hydroxyphenyl methylase/3-demethylubiquinone-9 3-methyltransferase